MISVTQMSLSQLSSNLVEEVGSLSLLASAAFTPVWESLHGRIKYWVGSDGGEIAAVLAGVEFGHGPLARFQSMPDGLPSVVHFRGNTQDIPQTTSHLLDSIAAHGYAKVFVTDFESVMPPHSKYTRRDAQTHVVNISSADYEPADRTLQSEIRKAERDGTRIVPFSWNQHGSSFIDLVTLSETRHGRLPKYPALFFERLAQVSETESRILWTWCEHEGKGVASHIYFIFRTSAINWQIYYDKDYSSLKANQLTTWQTIAHLRERGVAHLNLGASPNDAEGLVAYKSKWNATEHSYSIFEKKNWLGKLL